jgi:transcriptional regulator with XRE-family HTH domain
MRFHTRDDSEEAAVAGSPDPAGPASSPRGAAHLGVRLREARRAQRKTLAQVAAESGVTKGFVSKLENDQASASVATLVRLCEALSVPIGSLFEPSVGQVVRHDAYPPIEFGGSGMREFQLTPGSERRIQAILSEIEPGGGSGEARYTLPTDVEMVFVLAGRLQLDLAGDDVELAAGDALTFPASTPHSFRAVGARLARVLWVVTPALPAEGWRRPPASVPAPPGTTSRAAGDPTPGTRDTGHNDTGHNDTSDNDTSHNGTIARREDR